MDNILARTLYGEARGEKDPRARHAIANVIMNRLAQRPRYGDTVDNVCLKPWQFSCWNKNDPNRSIILAASVDNPIFRHCLAIADQALRGILPDITGGADHYYATWLPKPPGWSLGHTPTTHIGAHLFFNLRRPS